MPSPISRRPGGLLDLLLSQQQGKNPPNLSDSVLPTIQMLDFYSTDRQSVETSSRVYSAVAQSSNIDIPAAEVWRILGFGATWTWNAVDQSLRIGVQLQRLPSGSFTVGELEGPTTNPINATGLATVSKLCTEPLWLPPGSRIQFLSNEFDIALGANITATHSVLYTRMEV